MKTSSETDHEGRVEGYLCQNHGVLGEPLTSWMRRDLATERPLTEGDAKRWIARIDYHIGWRKKT